MWARRLTHPTAASFEPGANARFATSANSTRSVLGSRLRTVSRRVMTVSIPSRRHNASSTTVPPTGRDEVNTSSAGPADCVLVRAVAGLSSRVSDATSRLIASWSSWSSRPKLCSTFGREVLVAGSHSLWVSCRYRTAVPSLFRRVDTRTCTCPDTTRVAAVQEVEHRSNVCPVLRPRSDLPRHVDLGQYRGVCPDPPISCGTRVQDRPRSPTGAIRGLPYGSHPATCPVRAWRRGLTTSGIETGPAFRSVDRHGRLGAKRLSDRAVADMIKRRALAVGLDRAFRRSLPTRQLRHRGLRPGHPRAGHHAPRPLAIGIG